MILWEKSRKDYIDMQAFFYSTYRKLKDSGFLKEHDCEVVDEVPGHLQIFYNENHLSFYEVGREFLSNCGVIAFGNNFNKSVLKGIFCDDSRNLDWYLKNKRTHGQFFLLSYRWHKDRRKKELKLITDQFATVPVYIKYCADGNYEVSNVYRWLIDPMVGEVDLFALDQRLSIDWNYPMFTDNTLFENIKLAKPESVYLLDKKFIKREEYEKENYNCLPVAIRNNFQFLDDVNRIWCDVTGGFDTRLNLDWCLKRFVLNYKDNKKVLFGNDLSDNDKWLLKGKYSDYNICKQIEKEFGIKIHDYTGNAKILIDDWVNRRKDILQFNDSSIMSDKRLYSHWDEAHLADIKLTGFAGTEMLTNNSFNLFGDTWINHVKERQPHRDLLKYRFSYREDNGKTLVYKGSKNSYYWKLWEYMWNVDKIGNVETYSIWLTAFQNCQQSYWGVANLFMPMYSPYIDLLPILLAKSRGEKKNYKIQREYYDYYMLDGLKDINTTHGFPACEITWKNWYRFIRLFMSFGDYNLQYLNLYKRLKRYIINKILFHSPLYWKPLKWIGSKIFKKDMIFLNRWRYYPGLNEYVDLEKLDKIRIGHQPLLWIYKLDGILAEYLGLKNK